MESERGEGRRTYWFCCSRERVCSEVCIKSHVKRPSFLRVYFLLYVYSGFFFFFFSPPKNAKSMCVRVWRGISRLPCKTINLVDGETFGTWPDREIFFFLSAVRPLRGVFLYGLVFSVLGAHIPVKNRLSAVRERYRNAAIVGEKKKKKLIP